MIKNLFLFLFTIFNLQLSFSQNLDNETSLQSFNDLKENYFKHRYNQDFEKAKVYSKIFLKKAKVKKDTSKIAEGYFMMANTSYKDSVIVYLDSSIAITKIKSNFEQPAQSLLLKASVLAISGDYKRAFNLISEANKYANINKNEQQQLDIKYLLSRLQTEIGDYKSSIETLKEVILHYEKEILPDCNPCNRQYTVLLSAYANIYNALKRPLYSEGILNKAIPLSLKTKDSVVYGKLLLTSAITNYLKKDLRASLDSINKLNKVYKKKGLNINGIIQKHLYKGKIHLEQKDYILAIQEFKKVDSISVNSNYFHPTIRENYELLINYYKEQKDRKNQLFYINKLLKTDSVININYAYITKNIVKQYTTPNLILEKQKIIDSLEKNDSSKNLIFSILIPFILLLSIALIWNNKKRKLYKKRITELGEQKKTDTHIIDDETTKRILDELSKIEDSELFLEDNFNLNMLAKHLNTNTAYLSKIINQHKQKSFKQYLISLRINILLDNLDKNPILRKYSIEALAESIGYNNPSSFTRIFKGYLGESPSSFLNKKYPERKN